MLACLLLGISFTCRVSSHGIFIVMFLMLFKYGSGAWIFDKAEDAKYKPEPSIPRVIWPDGNTDVLHVVLLIFNDKFSPPTIFATAFSQKLDNYANSDESLMWIDLHTLRLEPYESFCEYSERRYSRT